MKRRKREQGFSYIDIMVALTLMLIGILAMTGAVMANLVRSYDTDKQVIAKQLALSTVETVFSAKEIKKNDSSGNFVTGWDSIGNVGSNPVNGVPQGIFLTGFRPVRVEEGADGIFGTADDACSGSGSCDGANGTVNSSAVVLGYQRQIEITDVQEGPNDPIKKRLIKVTIKYDVNAATRTETMSTMVSFYQ